jgi:V/A-type H+-transporting ATPase subunit I
MIKLALNGIPMSEMRKLKVLVVEDSIDAVIRSLGDVGVVQFVDMPENLEAWGGTLKPYEVSAEITNRITNIISRLNRLIETLEIKPGEIAIEKVPLSKERSEEVLTKIEEKLSELEKRYEKIEEKLSELEKRYEKTADTVQEKTTLLDRLKTLTSTEDALLKKAVEDLEEEVATEKAKLEKEVLAAKAITEVEGRITEVKPTTGEVREDLLVIRGVVQAEKETSEVKTNFARTIKTIYFEAWTPTINVEEVVKKIKTVCDGNCLIADEMPTPGEIVPINIKPTRSYLQAFENLTFAFGYPSSGELNPISIVAITFSILFGIMFADVGQGAILVIVGAILTYFRRKIQLDDVGEIPRYMLVSSGMFVLWGISAIFFGFLFGEFFGPSGVIHPMSLGKFGPIYIGGFEPIHEPMKMLRFTIFVGVIHLSLGLILRLVNEVKRHHYKLIPLPICWLWLLIGGFFMWSYWGGISNITKWFAEGTFMLTGLIVLPLILVIVFTGIAEGIMEGIGFGIEVFAESLSHTMSYCRLMALGLIHGAMNQLFLVLGGVEHGHFPPMSIPIVAIGTLLVLVIEGLVVFVHTLRLHWVEWFSKFYSAEGIPFIPFKFETS